MNREELAWAGGFFSGEGYTGLSRMTKKNRSHYKKYPAMTICQTGDGEELYRFNSAIMNLGKVRGPYGPYSTTRKSYYQLAITSFEKVQAVVAMLWPFLSSAKQTQARGVLKDYLKQPERATEILKTHCIRGHKFTKENTYVVPKTGYRQCKSCNRLRSGG